MAKDLSTEELQRLARLGALARLDQLRREEAAIRAAFPDLFKGRASAGRRGRGRAKRAGNPGDAPARRSRRMSPAEKKAVSERMKKYWAQQRNKAKAEKK